MGNSAYLQRFLSRAEHKEADEPLCDTQEMRVWVNPQKESIYSIEGTIGKKCFCTRLLDAVLVNSFIYTVYFSNT